MATSTAGSSRGGRQLSWSERRLRRKRQGSVFWAGRRADSRRRRLEQRLTGAASGPRYHPRVASSAPRKSIAPTSAAHASREGPPREPRARAGHHRAPGFRVGDRRRGDPPPALQARRRRGLFYAPCGRATPTGRRSCCGRSRGPPRLSAKKKRLSSIGCLPYDLGAARRWACSPQFVIARRRRRDPAGQVVPQARRDGRHPVHRVQERGAYRRILMTGTSTRSPTSPSRAARARIEQD